MGPRPLGGASWAVGRFRGVRGLREEERSSVVRQACMQSRVHVCTLPPHASLQETLSSARPALPSSRWGPALPLSSWTQALMP